MLVTKVWSIAIFYEQPVLLTELPVGLLEQQVPVRGNNAGKQVHCRDMPLGRWPINGNVCRQEADKAVPVADCLILVANIF
jgi:hypothetical protein